MIGQRKSGPGSLRLVPWILAPLLLVGVVAQTHHLRGLEFELDELRSAATNAVQGRDALEGDLTRLRTEVSTLEEDLGAMHEEAARARALAVRIAETEGQLGAIGDTVEAHSGSLLDLAEAQASFGPSTLAEELAVRDARILEHYRALNAQVHEAAATADASKRFAEDLDARLQARRDLQQMWRELVGPVVQLAGEESVGSGVLLRSSFDPERDAYSTYLITAWHVVRDIQGSVRHRERPVPVAIYHEDGTTRSEEAMLLCFDEEIDAALLELVTADELPNAARLPTREELSSVRIFDQVYAVGCPLGNDPIPTHGEISTSHHIVDNEQYWMINAPTYIGNSGGGIFHSETHTLLGIFSKIYTHGAVRPTIIPHMGLATPLATIYDWLATEGYEVAAGPAEAGCRLVAANSEAPDPSAVQVAGHPVADGGVVTGGQ